MIDRELTCWRYLTAVSIVGLFCVAKAKAGREIVAGQRVTKLALAALWNAVVVESDTEMGGEMISDELALTVAGMGQSGE